MGWIIFAYGVLGLSFTLAVAASWGASDKDMSVEQYLMCFFLWPIIMLAKVFLGMFK